MRIGFGRLTRRTTVVVAVSAALLVAAALLPTPGALPAAATGVVTCVVALILSVRDALVATVIGAALMVIAVGAGTNVVLAVVFMGAVALAVVAAVRVGRGSLALVVGAQLSLHVTGSAAQGASMSALSVGGMALSAGLLVCGAAVFVVPWRPTEKPRPPRVSALAFAAILIPVVVLATWASVTVLAETRGWALATLFIVLAVGATNHTDVVRVSAAIAGAFGAALVVAIAAGVPVLVLILAVLTAAYCAGRGRHTALAAALATSVLLVSASNGDAIPFGPGPLLAAIAGSFTAWGVAVLAAQLRPVLVARGVTPKLQQ